MRPQIKTHASINARDRATCAIARAKQNIQFAKYCKVLVREFVKGALEG